MGFLTELSTNGGLLGESLSTLLCFLSEGALSTPLGFRGEGSRPRPDRAWEARERADSGRQIDHRPYHLASPRGFREPRKEIQSRLNPESLEKFFL